MKVKKKQKLVVALPGIADRPRTLEDGGYNPFQGSSIGTFLSHWLSFFLQVLPSMRALANQSPRPLCVHPIPSSGVYLGFISILVKQYLNTIKKKILSRWSWKKNKNLFFLQRRVTQSPWDREPSLQEILSQLMGKRSCGLVAYLFYYYLFCILLLLLT